MRRRPVVATAALIAAFALAALPVPVGSRSPSAISAIDQAAFRTLDLPATLGGVTVPPVQLDHARDSASVVNGDATFAEPGTVPKTPALRRPAVDQPTTAAGSAWKEPKQKLSGYASFYDAGYTAMRLPRGTVIVICGDGGCIQRTVTDYGPSAAIRPARIIDLYRGDFFAVCGCPSWSGTTWVTVSVY